MFKFFKLTFIAILLLIITILSAYIIITDKPSLLRVPINFYLQKYSISSKMDRIKINSPSSFEIKGFKISKDNMSISADLLRIYIVDKSLSLYLKNPIINIKSKKGVSNKKSGSFSVPFKIGKVSIENLTLNFIKNSHKIVSATHCNITIVKDTITSDGIVKYSDNGTNILSDIRQMKGKFKLNQNGINFKTIFIDPNLLSVDSNGVKFKTAKPVRIKNLYLRFNPFAVKNIEYQSKIDAKYKKTGARFDIKVLLHNKIVKMNINNLKIENYNAIVEKIEVRGIIKKKLKFSAEYNNFSIDYKNVTAENLCGSIDVNSLNNIDTIIKNGEAAVYDRWYFDFSKNSIKANIKNLKSIDLSFAKLLDLKIKKKESRINFLLSSSNADNFFKAFVKEPFVDDFQSLDSVKLKGGFLLNGMYDTVGKRVATTINAKLNSVEYNNLKIGKVDLKLPFLYNIYKKADGFLQLYNISYDKYNFQVKCSIKSSNKKISISYAPIKTDEFYIAPNSITVDIRNRLIASRFKFNFKNKKVAMKGDFKKIILTKQNSFFAGSVKIKVFDGFAEIKNIKVDDILKIPIIKSDVVFRHINLKKVTQGTNFGMVTGFVQGYIKNFSLVNFTKPLSFNLLVRTQDVKGSTQKINLKAVNSISKLGGGYASIAIPFFRNFSYSKIGFSAKLKNNMFYFHGLYKNGDKEYIIKKGFLTGIDVINMNRNNQISWQDMLERIERIKTGGM